MYEDNDAAESPRSGVRKNADTPVIAREVAGAKEALEGTSLDLAEQREWFQVILSSIGDAVIVTDDRGAIKFLNPEAERLTGWRAEEARGLPFKEVAPMFHEQTGAPAEDPVERVLREGVVAGIANHTVLRSRSGIDIPIEDSAAPIRGEAGQIRGVVLVFHDVTEKHLRERELRESEARARAIIDTALDAVVLMSADGKIAGWSAAAERIFGWKREEVLGSGLAERIIPERMRQAHYRGLKHLAATGEGPVLGRLLELSAVRRDGVEFPVELSISPLPEAHGTIFVGFIRDISQRKASEAALAERVRLSNLRADIAALLAASASLDESLRGCCALLVNHLDAAFARIWTVDPAEPVLVLRASAGLYTHLDGPHARVPIGKFKIGRIARDGRPLLTNDVANDPNISDPEWARREGMSAFAGYPLIVDRRVLGVLALFSRNSLTEAVLGDLAPIADAIASSIEHHAAQAALVAEKERAEVASRAKDNFLAALSHELRTPLTPVLMTAAALREDDRLPADVRDQLGMMGRNIAIEARLIDDLLDLTRISRGKLPLQLQACDVHSLIGLAVEIVRSEAQTKGIVIDRQFEATHSGLMGDPARFEQVIWNLLRNAVKYTPGGGRVTVRTSNERPEHSAPRLKIEVADTGIGIEPEFVERIFQAFEQGGISGDHRFGGLGLGLSIARAIVDLHGGSIRAESAGAGQGATFIIELPEAIEPPHGAPTRDHDAHPGPRDLTARSLRLLVVEDHRATRDVLKRLLNLAGHQVVAVEGVASALAAAAREAFDAVISDLGLPDGTGNELMAQLRDRHGLRGIALSGYGMEKDTELSRESGFIAHLIKPVDFDQLRRTLEALSAC